MKISDIYNKKETVVSCEIFPPKQEVDISTIYDTLSGIKDLSPDFISVTYGAGGSNSKRTLEVASVIKEKYRLEPLMHLTCVNSSKKEISSILDKMKAGKIENVLALRGDMPEDKPEEICLSKELCYASDLVKFIRKTNNFCIGAAGYPEVHPEAENMKEDIKHLKIKTDAGSDFIISQLFFDNDYFYRYRDNLSSEGIELPLSAGIMPMFKKKLVNKIVSMCGAAIPAKLRNIMDRYGDNDKDMQKAGIDYASSQISELLEQGVDGIHLYTMNKSNLAKKIFKNTGLTFRLKKTKT